MGLMANRARRGLTKTFRAEFDEFFSIYEAAVKANNPAAPWPPRVSYVASTFDKARRRSIRGRPFPEDVELQFLDEALAYASARAEVDGDLLFTAARIALAQRAPGDAERRALAAAMAKIDEEQARRAD
jgi:hypothetical protein